MGGDGGSFPGRADVIRVKGYGFKRNLGGMGYDPNTLVQVSDGSLSKDEKRALELTHCHLSQEPLCPPIVVDRKGHLYNKEGILVALISKQLPEPMSSYIKKRKDLVQIVPSTASVSSNFPVFDEKQKCLQCPFTGTQFSLGASDFYVNWLCGCVFSKKAMDQIALLNSRKNNPIEEQPQEPSTADSTVATSPTVKEFVCPLCSKKSTAKDIVCIAPRETLETNSTKTGPAVTTVPALQSKKKRRKDP